MEVDTLVKNVAADAERHHKLGRFDGLLHNGSTVLVVVCSSLAALLPGWGGWFVNAAQLLSVVAAVVVGVDRILRFGERWSFHREMEFAYKAVLDCFSFAELSTESQRDEQLRAARERLIMCRSRESGIPGAERIAGDANAPAKNHQS